jgi:hypothetical protein
VDASGNGVNGSCTYQAATGRFLGAALVQIVGEPATVKITGGILYLKLVPTDTALPTGQYYSVNCEGNLGWRLSGNWIVPTSSTPLTLSAIWAPVIPTAGVYFPPSSIAQTGASVGMALCWNGTAYVPAFCGSNIWGTITGTLSSQTDLAAALAAKQNTIAAYTTISGLSGYPSLFPPVTTGSWTGTWQALSPSHFQPAITGAPGTWPAYTGAVVGAGQGNTYTTGEQNFGAATMALPSAFGFRASNTSSIGIDSNSGFVHIYNNYADEMIPNSFAQQYLQLNTGSVGNPTGNCSAPSLTNLSVYFDGSNRELWYCIAINTWSRAYGQQGTTAAIPGSCAVGSVYFATDATAGQNLYLCGSTNTWTQQLNSSSGSLVMTTGAGAPSASCTGPSSSNLAVYVDTASGNEWWCSATNTWREVVSTAGSGPFQMSGSTGSAPSTPASGTVICYFDSTLAQVCIDASGNAWQMIKETTLVGLDTRSCDIPVGDQSASAAIATLQLGPQKRLCYIPAASTIVEMDVSADGGTPNVIVGRNHAGTVTAIVSGALATAASGGIACANTGATLGMDGATTCSGTLQNTSLAKGDYLELVSGTPGLTAKLMTIHILYTIN